MEQLPTTMTSLQLTSAQVEQLTGVPKRRVNEMAEKKIIPSTKIGGGEKKVHRAFSLVDLELIKQQYDLNYPQRRPGMNTETAERIESLESRVAGLVETVDWLLRELGLTGPPHNTPGEAPQEPSTATGE